VAVGVAQLLPHPSGSDLALLRLQGAVPFGRGVGPVCLPSPTLSFPPGTPCVSTGWGE
ncbi:BSSP4 protease, partial [Thryothorus ludovicianus]|nr:BSSP4 protease [Thryothorus ludovicianus]